MTVAQSTRSVASDAAIRDLHRALLAAWNARNASAFANLFTQDGASIGFDGSIIVGRDAIASHLQEIFAHHQTAAYIAIVKEVRSLAQSVVLLRASVGMVPPGQNDINPAVNAIQAVVAVEQDGKWQIAQLQNTPAAFHGRPELSEQLTTELRDALRRSS